MFWGRILVGILWGARRSDVESFGRQLRMMGLNQKHTERERERERERFSVFLKRGEWVFRRQIDLPSFITWCGGCGGDGVCGCCLQLGWMVVGEMRIWGWSWWVSPYLGQPGRSSKWQGCCIALVLWTSKGWWCWLLLLLPHWVARRSNVVMHSLWRLEDSCSLTHSLTQWTTALL